jgi:predicted alpha/beta-hydrolase family hydrolase
LASERGDEVSALLLQPQNARSLLVLAHGAGAGMRHKFMEDISQKLASQGVSTLRYQFPYTEKRIKRPDPEAVLIATVRSAVAAAQEYANGLPLFAGGKSMGGRMTSLAMAKEPLKGVRGLVFFGFPLHAPGNRSAKRGDHLADVAAPMLFLQGSRDSLADLKLLKPLCNRLGDRAELYVVDGGDHSFDMLKSSGRSDDEVLDDVAQKVGSWLSSLTEGVLEKTVSELRRKSSD